MMRGLQIGAMAFSVLFFFIAAYYVSAVNSAKIFSYLDSYSSSYGDYSSLYSSYSDSYSDLTFTAGIYSLLFCLFFAAVHILSILKIKTKTMKVLSIIGVSLTGIMLLLAFLAIGSSGGASYDEIGPLFVIYCLVALAFHIVGTIHAFKTNS